MELTSLITGGMHIKRVELERPRFDVVRGEAGDDNISSILDKLREKKSGGGGTGAGGTRIDLVRIKQGNIRVTDEALGQAEVKSLDGDLRPDGPATLHIKDARLQVAGARAAADDATIDVTLAHGKPVGLPTLDVKNGSLTPVQGLALTGIRASVRPDADGQRQTIDVHGSYGGASTELWNAVGWLRADAREGKLTLRCDRFKLSQLDSVLRNKDGSAEVLNASKGEMDAHLDLAFRDERLAFIGAAHLAGLTVAHPMLAPVAGAAARVRRAHQGRRSRPRSARSSWRRRRSTSATCTRSLTADVANVGRKPRFAATLQVQPLPCQIALQALPVGAGAVSAGLQADGHVLDRPARRRRSRGPRRAGRPRRPRRHRRLQGDAGAGVDVAEAAEGRVRAHVEYEKGEWMSFIVGPENPDFVPFARDLAAPRELDHDDRGLGLLQAPRLHPVASSARRCSRTSSAATSGRARRRSRCRWSRTCCSTARRRWRASCRSCS